MSRIFYWTEYDIIALYFVSAKAIFERVEADLQTSSRRHYRIVNINGLSRNERMSQTTGRHDA